MCFTNSKKAVPMSEIIIRIIESGMFLCRVEENLSTQEAQQLAAAGLCRGPFALGLPPRGPCGHGGT